MLVSPKAPHLLEPGEPEFGMILSKRPTAHSMYLPETSRRYQALKSTDGAIIEVSPESQVCARDFAIRLGGSNPVSTASQPGSLSSGRRRPSPSQEETFVKPKPSGAALIIDYGPASAIPSNSLRGIRSHQRVSPLEAPAIVDVSADVDFIALAEAAIDGSPGVEVHGPVNQARFLSAMGIRRRSSELSEPALRRAMSMSAGKEKSDLVEGARRIAQGMERLIDESPQGMGQLYQVMAIVPHLPPVKGQAVRRPVGFGGDVRL